MRIFAPNRLIQVVAQIKKDHPLTGELSNGLSSESLKELVMRINQKEYEELDGTAASLTRRQVQALCSYLPTNAYQVDLQKVQYVIGKRMDAACFQILFRQWQRVPESRETLFLLGAHDTKENRPEGFVLRYGLLLQWSRASRPLMAVARSVEDFGQGAGFLDRLSSMGLGADTALAQQCFLWFLCGASVTQFLYEGDRSVCQGIRKRELNAQKLVLLHMLHLGVKDKNFLTKFPGAYAQAYRIWGYPQESDFQERELFETYTWWYNYYQLSEAMHGDANRIAFWKQFLDRCQCSRITKHQMLIMRFHNHVVTEFEQKGQGPAYIFAKNYFDDTVVEQINRFNNPQELKSWMLHYSKRLSRVTHRPGSWESTQYSELIKNHVI